MAKSDYICKICREVKGTGWLGGSSRYVCPTHKIICGDHVSFWNKCVECDKKVMRYEFDEKKSKWVKV